MITQTRPAERTTPVSSELDITTTVRALWLPLSITLLVVLGAILGPSALTDPVTGTAADRVGLEVGWGYILMAPVTTILDTLSVLTLAQHYAVLVTLMLLYALWRIVRTRRRLGLVRRSAVELGTAVGALLGLAAFYAYGIVGPRPMAALVPEDEDEDVVVVDVHSHTEHSHDGRPGFDAEDNREWHASAGFDAVFVSDHRTWDGYLEGAPNNPELAGEGTVLLPALEIRYDGKYASALGEAWRYRGAMDGNDLIQDSIYRLYRETGIRPTLVLTIPGGLDDVVASTPDTIGYVAIELSDAAPRGLQQGRRDRARLLHMADSMNLAPVAASNNHGWGRTAAAWTLMRIPGWQRLTPQQLTAAIERKLHEERGAASRVVERRTPWFGDHPAALALTLPAITWNMFGGMSPAERVSWLLWLWLLAAVIAFGLAPARPALALLRRERDRSR